MSLVSTHSLVIHGQNISFLRSVLFRVLLLNLNVYGGRPRIVDNLHHLYELVEGHCAVVVQVNLLDHVLNYLLRDIGVVDLKHSKKLLLRDCPTAVSVKKVEGLDKQVYQVLLGVFVVHPR